MVPLSSTRPPSPSPSSRPAQHVRYDSSSYPSRSYEPRIDPFALFESVYAHAEQMVKSHGFRYTEEERLEEHHKSRIGNAESHQNMINALLPPDDPYRSIGREHDRGRGDPWGRPLERLGEDMWGRRFEGEVRPARDRKSVV